jgi:hypothetical protein
MVRAAKNPELHPPQYLLTTYMSGGFKRRIMPLGRQKEESADQCNRVGAMPRCSTPTITIPSVVFTPGLRLLERSILLTCWVQPCLVMPDSTIIDGFHRVMLSRESAALRKRYAGQVPCAVIDVLRDKAMILRIRMNRAKGSHVAVRMSEIVRGADRRPSLRSAGGGDRDRRHQG